MKQNNNGHIVTICYRKEKTLKDGRKIAKEVSATYEISKEIASRGDIARLDIPEEVAAVLHESDCRLKNVHNYEYKHDVLHYEEGVSEWAMDLEREAIFQTVCDHIRYETLHEAMQRLSACQRRRFYLHYGLGCTYREIAEMEGVSQQCIQRSVRRAKKKIMNNV